MFELTSVRDLGDGGEQEVLILGLQHQHVPQYLHHGVVRARTSPAVVHQHAGRTRVYIINSFSWLTCF